MRLGKFGAAAAAVLLATVTLTACGDAEEGGSATIRLAHTNSVVALAVWVADEQGFFDKHGLDVELKEISTTVASQVPSLLGRQYDIAQMTPTDMVTAADSGVPVRAVAGNYVNKEADDGFLIIARKDSGIESAKDLTGKRLAAPSINGNINVASMHWLKSEGVDVSTINVVTASTPNMPDLLENGRVDAVEMVMPFNGKLLADGHVQIGNPLPAVADPVHMSFWAADRDWSETNAKTISQFRAALTDAGTWIKENEQDAIKFLIEKTGTSAQFAEYIKLPEFTADLTPQDLEPWLTALKNVNDFTTDKPTEEMVLQ